MPRTTARSQRAPVAVALLLGALLLPSIMAGQAASTEQGPKQLGDGPVWAESFARRIAATNWVAYAPTNYNPQKQPPVVPGLESIREDLKVLRDVGFDGLVTYGVDVPGVYEVAEDVGFCALLVGVWDPMQHEELLAAVKLAASPHVIGTIVGNEGLMTDRYSVESLIGAMRFVRESTGKPVSTTEVYEYFLGMDELVAASDFLAVNAHPFFHGHRDPKSAADWTIRAYEELTESFPERPVLFKEVGLPSAGGPGLSEDVQREYYRLLAQSPVTFALFEAYDALFKAGPVEQSWGLFRSDRTPKKAVSILRAAAAVCPQ